MLGGSVEVWTKNILYQYVEGQTHSDLPRGAKKSLALMNQNRPLFIEIQTLPLRMQHKWKKLLILYAKEWIKFLGDQLLMQFPIEIKDNSNIHSERKGEDHRIIIQPSTWDQELSWWPARIFRLVEIWRYDAWICAAFTYTEQSKLKSLKFLLGQSWAGWHLGLVTLSWPQQWALVFQFLQPLLSRPQQSLLWRRPLSLPYSKL